jgi:long-chain acyl-CoA synthetase
MDAVRDASKAVAAESERLVSGLRQATNAKLASFSRLARIAIRDMPFEKTATLKIKRFLYPDAEAAAQ